MRLAFALVLALAPGCSPVLVTYVAPPTATNIRSSNPGDLAVAKVNGIEGTGASALAFAGDLPMARRTVTFTCADGADVSRELVSDTQDTARGILGTLAFLLGTSSTAIPLKNIIGNTGNNADYYAVAAGGLVALFGATAVLFGWHPAPAVLFDGTACAGHDAPAAVISEPSSTSSDG